MLKMTGPFCPKKYDRLLDYSVNYLWYNEKPKFFLIATGSVFECSSMINFLHAEGEVTADFRNDIYLAFDEISRILML